MVFLHEGEARNSSLITIKSLQFNINSETSYVSLAQVVAAKLYIYESRGGGQFNYECAAANSFETAIESLKLNVNFETSNVFLAKVVAVNL